MASPGNRSLEEIDALMVAISNERGELTSKLSALHAALANKDWLDARGQRCSYAEYQKVRASHVQKVIKLQARAGEIRAELHELTVERNALRNALKLDVNTSTQTLVRRLVAIIDRLGGNKLTDAESDIVDEAVVFCGMEDQ